MSQPIVDLEHVFVARGASVILNDVSLRIERGEHVVILGPNGCGKSTLLKTLTCELYPLSLSEDSAERLLGTRTPPKTRVEIMGRQRWDLIELKRRMGVVSAELPGKPTLTTSGYDAILTGFFSASTLWPNLTVTEEMRAKAEDILKLVGAEKLRDKHVGEMSAGQTRRVMIGRAIAGNRGVGESSDPKMLLLDEPTNALDLAAQQDLRELMQQLAEQGTAILLITHHIADILPEMHRIVMMRDGRIIEDGAKDALLNESQLSELFGRRIFMSERDGFFNAW
ncbi:ABC transporter ATP-binding protein [Granulicella cerasi]|uniref:ABC transporter ATP-binding protein n=1 Tax=Granulicella cerasi TaxID=741063 RepID=A0ABW1Z5X4_9BACT|nr:ATP-binding cassette domain-containing protein [Granulicella cerasi]